MAVGLNTRFSDLHGPDCISFHRNAMTSDFGKNPATDAAPETVHAAERDWSDLRAEFSMSDIVGDGGKIHHWFFYPFRRWTVPILLVAIGCNVTAAVVMIARAEDAGQRVGYALGAVMSVALFFGRIVWGYFVWRRSLRRYLSLPRQILTLHPEGIVCQSVENPPSWLFNAWSGVSCIHCDQRMWVIEYWNRSVTPVPRSAVNPFPADRFDAVLRRHVDHAPADSPGAPMLLWQLPEANRQASRAEVRYTIQSAELARLRRGRFQDPLMPSGSRAISTGTPQIRGAIVWGIVAILIAYWSTMIGEKNRPTFLDSRLVFEGFLVPFAVGIGSYVGARILSTRWISSDPKSVASLCQLFPHGRLSIINGGATAHFSTWNHFEQIGISSHAIGFFLRGQIEVIPLSAFPTPLAAREFFELARQLHHDYCDQRLEVDGAVRPNDPNPYAPPQTPIRRL
jgi:hypothetical protein